MDLHHTVAEGEDQRLKLGMDSELGEDARHVVALGPDAYVEPFGDALGVVPARVISPYVQATVAASLIPRIDSMRSLGIVWIPGLMAGMVLSGTDPVYAAVYQFAVIAMILASSGLTSLVSTLLIRSRAFSDAEQLVLRPEAS